MTNPDDLTQAEREQYEEEWEQIDEKVLLAQILTELQQIRMALTQADTGDESAPTEYRCTKCPGDQRVPAGDRERHAKEQHKAPEGMIDEIFTAVE